MNQDDIILERRALERTRQKLLARHKAELAEIQAKFDVLRAEVEELREREAEHDRLREAIRDDARKALCHALGRERWNALWGPELEALASVVFAVWMERERLREEVKRLRAVCQMALDLTQQYPRPASNAGYVFSNRVTEALLAALGDRP